MRARRRDPLSVRAGSFAALLVVAAGMACSRLVDGGPTPRRGVRALASAGPAALRAVQVAAGAHHTCARMSDATVRCWGAGNCGQLGAPAPDTCRHLVVLHPDADRPFPCRDSPGLVDLAGVAEIAAADEASCARLQDGTVRCWGCSAYGLFGDGAAPHAAPVVVAGLSDVAQIALATDHACARFRDGGVACWGDNRHGQLGTRAARGAPPARVPGLTGVVDVAVGERLTCARLAAGEVTCFGQLTYQDAASAAPRVVPALRGARALALGHDGHCGLFEDGAVRCVGRSHAVERFTATRAPADASTPDEALVAPSSLAITLQRGCAVVAGEGVRCWGAWSATGQPPNHGPRPVALPVAAVQVALGYDHGCAVGRDGSVWCWGAASFGEAGPRAGAAVRVHGFWTPPRRAWP